jgi:hypothetical protein
LLPFLPNGPFSPINGNGFEYLAAAYCLYCHMSEYRIVFAALPDFVSYSPERKILHFPLRKSQKDLTRRIALRAKDCQKNGGRLLTEMTAQDTRDWCSRPQSLWLGGFRVIGLIADSVTQFRDESLLAPCMRQVLHGVLRKENE